MTEPGRVIAFVPYGDHRVSEDDAAGNPISTFELVAGIPYTVPRALSLEYATELQRQGLGRVVRNGEPTGPHGGNQVG